MARSIISMFPLLLSFHFISPNLFSLHSTSLFFTVLSSTFLHYSTLLYCFPSCFFPDSSLHASVRISVIGILFNLVLIADAPPFHSFSPKLMTTLSFPLLPLSFFFDTSDPLIYLTLFIPLRATNPDTRVWNLLFCNISDLFFASNGSASNPVKYITLHND